MTWYTDDPTYDTVLLVAFAFVALTAVGALFVQSPYGRFSSDRFGATVGPRLGWFLMELPSTVSFVVFFALGANRAEPVPLILLAVWLIHYANRGFVFPLLIRAPRGAKASFSLMIVGIGWLVTTLHGYLNGTFISELGSHFTLDWLTDPRFLVGMTVYYVSFGLNLRADAVIRNLRTREEVASGAKVYRIPRGGLFEYVTCASYLTELTAWAGFALLTWSLAGVYIFAISLANLVPRALATHRWYLATFEDYPKTRKALIPFVI